MDARAESAAQAITIRLRLQQEALLLQQTADRRDICAVNGCCSSKCRKRRIVDSSGTVSSPSCSPMLSASLEKSLAQPPCGTTKTTRPRRLLQSFPGFPTTKSKPASIAALPVMTQSNPQRPTMLVAEDSTNPTEDQKTDAFSSDMAKDVALKDPLERM